MKHIHSLPLFLTLHPPHPLFSLCYQHHHSLTLPQTDALGLFCYSLVIHFCLLCCFTSFLLAEFYYVVSCYQTQLKLCLLFCLIFLFVAFKVQSLHKLLANLTCTASFLCSVTTLHPCQLLSVHSEQDIDTSLLLFTGISALFWKKCQISLTGYVIYPSFF